MVETWAASTRSQLPGGQVTDVLGESLFPGQYAAAAKSAISAKRFKRSSEMPITSVFVFSSLQLRIWTKSCRQEAGKCGSGDESVEGPKNKRKSNTEMYWLMKEAIMKRAIWTREKSC